MESIVVIGAGQAGATVVEKMRAMGFAGRLTLIGDEPLPPYQRPPLTKKYLSGDLPEERLYLRPVRFYQEREIMLVTGAPVRAIDGASRHVSVDGRRIRYDRLVLATGARARPLPVAQTGNLSGVYPVRTLADVDALAPEVTAGRRVLVVGGGYIGLEVAAVCASRGLQVVVIESQERILQRVACAATAGVIRDLHRSHGVDIREGVSLERLAGTGKVTAALLSTGEHVPVDFVIVGIGILPNAGLAEGAGLSVDNGIAVDERCRTSDPEIYAAGDCASFPCDGRRIRLECVQNAVEQAEHVAKVLMGSDEVYRPIPWFWSDQYDAQMRSVGLNAGYDQVVHRHENGSDKHSVWYFRGESLLAVDTINDSRAFAFGRRSIGAGISPDPVALADAQLDLRELVHDREPRSPCARAASVRSGAVNPA